jgi:coenzyme F420-reducing hydrogenase beta subunit
MVDVYKKEQCNGCKMCADICPRQAIGFETDKEGFWYPTVDYSRCIKCGLCVKSCPHNNGCIKHNDYLEVYAAWSNDDWARLGCTSGGIAYELGKKVICSGGYVIGCQYSDNFKGAEHSVAHEMTELVPLMQSKYLQSDTEEIYKKAGELLKKGKEVMFVGTPCQNAALTNFLGSDYPNLVQVEFICRGITSPLAHKRYIENLENKYGSEIEYFRSKDKRNGWNTFGTAARFKNGREYFSERGNDPKTVSYHSNLTVRQSCEFCACKTKNRVADITLADFWGIEKSEANPELEHGTSAVIISSEKGRRLFERLGDSVGYYPKTIDDVYRGNPALYNNISMSPYRQAFWKDFDNMPFDKLVRKYRVKKVNIMSRLYRKIAKNKIKKRFG